MPAKPILIVDDHAHVAHELRRYLTDHGYDVDICADPSEAYERCADRPGRYGLVFMDVHFPVGDVGIELARQIKTLSHQGGPNVILMTGYRDKFDSVEAQKVAADDVMLKPLFRWLVVNLADRHFNAA